MSTYITAVQITDVQAQALDTTRYGPVWAGIVRTIIDLISRKHYHTFFIQFHGNILTERNRCYIVFNSYAGNAGACVAVGIGDQ